MKHRSNRTFFRRMSKVTMPRDCTLNERVDWEEAALAAAQTSRTDALFMQRMNTLNQLILLRRKEKVLIQDFIFPERKTS